MRGAAVRTSDATTDERVVTGEVTLAHRGVR
jgi:hypothetical protein